MLAARHGNLKVLLFLPKQKQKWSSRITKGGRSRSGAYLQLDAVEVLLKAGAIKDSVDDDDKGPADWQ